MISLCLSRAAAVAALAAVIVAAPVALSAQGGGRALWIRILGYLAWLFIRLGLSVAVVAVVEIFYSSPSATVDNILMGTTWLVVNALAYPVLGCLDVVNHLETRMRTETGVSIVAH